MRFEWWGVGMWHCQKCGEELEDNFDACWNCGTSKEGVEDPEFSAEVDVVVTEPSGTANRCWNGFLAGGMVTAVLGFLDYFALGLIAIHREPLLRNNTVWVLASAALLSFFHAGGGAIAGWIGGKTNRMVGAAWRGVLVLLANLGIVLLIGSIFSFVAMPIHKIVAMFVNVSALGAIAGCTGVIFARPRPRGERPGEPIQYSLSELLFLSVLFSLLFASMAVLSR